MEKKNSSEMVNGLTCETELQQVYQAGGTNLLFHVNVLILIFDHFCEFVSDQFWNINGILLPKMFKLLLSFIRCCSVNHSSDHAYMVISFRISLCRWKVCLSKEALSAICCTVIVKYLWLKKLGEMKSGEMRPASAH